MFNRYNFHNLCLLHMNLTHSILKLFFTLLQKWWWFMSFSLSFLCICALFSRLMMNRDSHTHVFQVYMSLWVYPPNNPCFSLNYFIITSPSLLTLTPHTPSALVFPSGLDPKCPQFIPLHTHFRLSFSTSSVSLSLPSHLTAISAHADSRISLVVETGCGPAVLFQQFSQ